MKITYSSLWRLRAAVLTLQRNPLPPSNIKMNEARFSKTSLYFYHTILRHIQEQVNLKQHVT